MRRLVALLALAPAAAFAQGAPLDVNDPTPRDVLFQVESSVNLATVGQSFGPALPATYSASGGVGTLVIPIASHEAMRGGFPPIPGTFTPVVIHIDLATLAATSETASGAQGQGQFGISFSMNALATSGPAGFVSGPSLPPLFCTSQQQVDDICPVFPPFCGATCVLVPGVVYDPGTGKVNLVGSETVQGCDGAVCQGPFTNFTGLGDLRLLEANEVPALPWPAAGLAAALLALAATGMRRRPRA